MRRLSYVASKCGRIVLVAAAAGLVSTSALAASFQSLEQSAARLGTADSGTATNYDDAAVQFFNPGAMAFVKHDEVSASATLVAPKISFHPDEATNYNGDPVVGSNTGPAKDAVLPALYYVHPVGQRAVFGLGITVPFGLETRYPDNSKARYFATESSMTVFNLNPSLGFRFTDNFGAGFGVDIQHMHAELDQAFDAGSYLSAFKGTDIFVENSGNSWGYGWNGGLYYNFAPWLHAGLAYHSKVIHDFTGKSHLRCSNQVVLDMAKIMLGLQDTSATSTINLPANLTFSLQADINPRWKAMMDVEYVKWSVLNELTLRFGKGDPSFPPAPASVTIPLHYHDVFRLALGQQYQYNDKLSLRAGVAVDQSPTDSIYRTARIPDANRYWLSLGAGYKFTKQLSLDVGYSFIMFEHSRIHQEMISPVINKPVVLDAHYDGTAHLFGLQLNYKF